MGTIAIIIIILLSVFALAFLGLCVFFIFIIEELRIENAKLKIDILHK
jgi:hypothetical protein